MTATELIYLNNCLGRNHAKVYENERAFFDFSASGHQEKMAAGLAVGQECVVASLSKMGSIAFSWYSLEEERLIPSESGVLDRVFLGQRFFSESMSKPKAAKSKRYAIFFNSLGHFKRSSVLRATLAPRYYPPSKKLKVKLNPDEVDIAGQAYPEGATKTVVVNAYERNAAARSACLQHYGLRCAICDLSFAEAYGTDAEGYIHVHHRKPLAKLKTAYEVNPIKDLVPVCPNCHAVIHLGGANRSVDQVRAMIETAKSAQ
ncbi:HNH endonuclease [Novipirellula aureliae]|uniref:HNH endonuclease n=1 Tax=Novipirellula aureliae TaxID=2527966 RepID=A0A5C6DMV0_9BACT|nr:HNH endonuclease [Novipirellula aureliae]TWU37484.1 HNH endonuclease [Novipirellula aureliae]